MRERLRTVRMTDSPLFTPEQLEAAACWLLLALIATGAAGLIAYAVSRLPA